MPTDSIMSDSPSRFDCRKLLELGASRFDCRKLRSWWSSLSGRSHSTFWKVGRTPGCERTPVSKGVNSFRFQCCAFQFTCPAVTALQVSFCVCGSAAVGWKIKAGNKQEKCTVVPLVSSTQRRLMSTPLHESRFHNLNLNSTACRLSLGLLRASEWAKLVETFPFCSSTKHVQSHAHTWNHL